MRVPVIGVTGPIASGKTTLARFIARGGGALVDCDALGARALDLPAVRRRLVAAFGRSILTPGGSVSRRRLGRLVFASDRDLERLNRIVRPSLTRVIAAEVAGRRAGAKYIVLDAVLLFQYTFRFKIDYAVATKAPAGKRLARIMRRDRLSRAEALARMARQRRLAGGWARADERIATDRPLRLVRRDAERIKALVLARARRKGRSARCRKN
jgi:dephospho-CoA kinase